ncbi:MAG: pitrilysin family protein [Calditrichia bacterium]
MSIQNKPPIDSRILDFRFPKVKEHRLANGLKIMVVERHRLPKVDIRLGFDFGIKNDPEGQEGLCQLLAATLKKGTAKRDYATIAENIDYVGGALDALVSEDFFFVAGEFLKEHLEVGLDLFSEILFEPLFAEAEVEKERQKLIADLENENSSPQYLAHRRMGKALFDGHPYGRFKTVESLKNITRDDLIAFHRKYFAPAETVLVFAGDITEREARENCEKYFSGWHSPRPPLAAFNLPESRLSRRVYLVDRPGSEQINIVLGQLLFPRRHPDFEKMVVMNKILGGGGSGRLFLYLREEKGFTYGAYSTMQNFKESGSWLAHAEVRPEVTREALEGFFFQFRRMKEELVSAEDLHNTRRYLIGSFPLKNETPSSVASLVLKQELYQLPPGYWDTYLDTIAGVTEIDIQEMARKYIHEDQMVLVLVGEARDLMKQVEGYGEVEIYDIKDHRLKQAK